MTGNLTLLDIAKRIGSDATVGLVEEVLTVAPELQTLPVVPKSGTSYKITRRIGKPRGAFRSANEGVTPGKSQYEQIDVPMYFFDGQMVVDEAVVKADDRRLGDILAIEGAGQLQDTYVVMGDQIYRGQVADAKGFKGLKEQVDPTMVVNATGSGANATHTAWAVWENAQGLHLPIGNQGALSLGQWMKQQVSDTDGKKYMAWVNNLSFYMGLALGSKYCIGCVKNITSAAPLTDILGNELVSKFPVGRKPTRWFISRDAVFWLQKSRTAIGQVADSGGGTGFAPRPTSLAGIPIVETDSITAITNW
jgi:hypothetical protein